MTEHGPQFGSVEGKSGAETISRILPPFPEDRHSHINHSPAPSASFKAVPMASAKLLSPCLPSKVLCVGRNYRDHAAELGNEVPAEPLIFLKPPSAVTAPGADIVLPPTTLSRRVDYEGELAIVIGRTCRNLHEHDDVRPFIRGYTCANDVTARDLQNKDSQWARAKGFDTFCPLGPLVTDEVDPLHAPLELATTLNGAPRQHGSTRDFIFDIARVMRHITAFLTLGPGDVILTGTPAGVGPMQVGDIVEVTITGIGTLRNTVS